MNEPLRMLVVYQTWGEPHKWDLTDGSEDRKTSIEVVTHLCRDGGWWIGCGYTNVLELLDAHSQQPHMALFPLGQERSQRQYDGMKDMVEVVKQIQQRGIPCCTNLEDEHCWWLMGPNDGALATIGALDCFDGIWAWSSTLYGVLGHVTTAPRYLWHLPSETAIRMHDQPYPDGPRDLLLVSRLPADGYPGSGVGGTIPNLLAVKKLLEAHPELKLASIGNNRSGSMDSFATYLGLDAHYVEYQHGWRTWDDLIALAKRGVLGIHLERYQTVSKFVVDCAACGVPVISCDHAISTEYLGVLSTVRHWTDIDEAVVLAERYLNDPVMWEEESRRLFAVAKTADLTMTERMIDTILARFKEAHP